jgi:hypothetical protein
MCGDHDGQTGLLKLFQFFPDRLPDWGSRPVVGSSNINSSCRLISDLTKISRRVIPRESSMTLASFLWLRAKKTCPCSQKIKFRSRP